MYQLITSKGRKSAETLEALAAWLLEMQPSSTRIVHGDLEAEVEWSDDEPENDLRWALRLEEAPEHYRALWPNDPDDLPYVWPVVE